MFFVCFFLIQEIEALQEIINQLLDKGYTSHCCRLAAEFSVYNKNLAIVVVFISKNINLACLLLFKWQPFFTDKLGTGTIL